MSFLPFRDDIKEITAHRNPTSYELAFGYGAIHYRTFPVELWKGKNRKPKRYIKADDGLRYYR